MKSAIGLEAWLLLSLLIVMNVHAAAQSPQPQPDQQVPVLPALLRAKPVKEEPKDDELRRLLKARYNEAATEMGLLYSDYIEGRIDIGLLCETGHRLARAGVELRDKPDEKVPMLTQYVEMCTFYETMFQALFDAGICTSREFYKSRYQRLDAEIQLLRAKREATEVKGK